MRLAVVNHRADLTVRARGSARRKETTYVTPAPLCQGRAGDDSFGSGHRRNQRGHCADDGQDQATITCTEERCCWNGTVPHCEVSTQNGDFVSRELG